MWKPTFVKNGLNGDKGPALIRQKLITKGISKSVIDSCLVEVDFSNLIEKVAEKLLRKYQDKLPIRALQDKIVQGLMNKGFTYDLARKAVGQLDISADDNMEADLISKELEKLYRKYSRKYDGYELKQRLIHALARKGFEFDQIQAVLRNYL